MRAYGICQIIIKKNNNENNGIYIQPSALRYTRTNKLNTIPKIRKPDVKDINKRGLCNAMLLKIILPNKTGPKNGKVKFI